PVDRYAGGQIGGDLLHHPPLSACQRKGKQAAEFLRRRNPERCPRLLVPPVTEQGHTTGEEKQLLKNQTPPGGLQGRLVGREVDVSAGKFRRRQSVVLPQVVRQRLLYLPGTVLYTPLG